MGDQIEKKIVHQSSLALRFYIDDGWTKQELSDSLEKGEVYIAHPNDERMYITLNHTKGSKWNADKLIEKISEIKTMFSEHHDMSWRRMIEEDGC